MQSLKNITRLLALMVISLCILEFNNVCDALINVSYVVPDNGSFNSERLHTKYLKAPDDENVLRRITIYGSGFTRYMDVNFMHGNISKPVAEFKYISRTEVQVIPPDWEKPKGRNPISIDIEAKSRAILGDRDVLKKGFTYIPPPEVESIEPNVGPQNPSLLPDGKEIIQIKGSGFLEKDPTRPGKTLQVYIGTKQFTLPAIIYKNSQHLSLEFSEPLYSTEGTVDIIVVNPDGQTSAVDKRQYMIIEQPTIRIIRPRQGPIEGGNVVHIEGAGLKDGSFSVRVNGQVDKSRFIGDVMLINPDLSGASSTMNEFVAFTMPGGRDKNIDVQVIKHTVNQRGRSFDQISNPLKYTYLHLNVYRVEPDVGEQGTQVTITGEDFFIANDSADENNTVEVFFGGEIHDDEVIGGTKGVGLYVIDSTKLKVEAPEGTGIVPVFVQQSWQAGVEYQPASPFIRQTMNAKNNFTYSTGVVIDDFNPRKGSVVGGTTVTLTGANFYPDPSQITVTFGGVKATVLSAEREKLHVLTPSHNAGIVVVTVKNPDGSSDSHDGFEYIEGTVIETIEPNFGPIEGGNPITIIGKRLLETGAVFIGGEKAALGVREYSKVVVNAVPQMAQAGKVDVVAYVAGQPDAVLPDGYIYQEVEARELFPDNGPIKGGNTIIIQGRDFVGWDYDRQKPIAPMVDFGGVKVTVINYTQNSIEVVAPKGTGTVPVKIMVRYLYTTPGETMPKEVKQIDTDLIYRYNSLPVIASFRPLAGNKGDNLFIEGSGFLAGAEVKVGTTFVQPVAVSETEIRIIVPEPNKDECEVDVVVVNPDGQKANAPEKFEYLDCTQSKPPIDDECSNPEHGWRATLTLISGENSTALTFGIDPKATDGFNPEFDSAGPPLFPGADFSAAFAGEFINLVADIRGLDELENTWTIILMSQDHAAFEADVSEIPECFAMQLGSIDLRRQSSGRLESGKHLLIVKPYEAVSSIDGPTTVTISLARGWNLISFPGELVDASPQSILGSSVIQILDSNLAVPETLTIGEGYWVLAITPVELEVVLKPATEYTRFVKRGWNLIGSVIFNASMPEGVIQLVSWNAETQEYESPTTLLPTVGYWAFVLEDREITVGTDPPPAPGAPKATSAADERILETLWNLPLMLNDAKGHRNTLEIGIAPQATLGYDQHLDKILPPPTPDSQNALISGFLFEKDRNLYLQKATHSLPRVIGDFVLAQEITHSPDKIGIFNPVFVGVFDLPRVTGDSVRAKIQRSFFSSAAHQRLISGYLAQRSVFPLAAGDEVHWSLLVSSTDSAATLHWESAKIPSELFLQLVDENHHVDMRHVSSYQIPQGTREIQFVICRKPQEIKPSKSLLRQNFPNPFNPETWIPYQLADSAEVSLTIYDIHGRIVREFVLGRKDAGIYVDRSRAIYWDGRNYLGERVSSGLYFYRLKAENFSAVRRMVITK